MTPVLAAQHIKEVKNLKRKSKIKFIIILSFKL